MLKKSAELKNIFRIDQFAKDGYRENHGWQVRLAWYGKQYTKFFRDSKYNNREEGLIDSKLYRDNLIDKLEKEVGLLADFKPGGLNRHKIKLTLPKNNTSGILGVTRMFAKQRKSRSVPVWQTAYPSISGKMKVKKYYSHRLGEIEALYKAIEKRIEGLTELIGEKYYEFDQENINILVDRYLNMLVHLEQLDEDGKKEFIKIVINPKIINTKKEDIILGRVGQKSFQDKLKQYWKNKCAITGANILLFSSHIKPWKNSTDRERLDVYNGLLLSPNIDQAFDKGFISFEDNGKIIISSFYALDLKLLRIDSSIKISGLTPFHNKYLEYHRNNILKNHV